MTSLHYYIPPPPRTLSFNVLHPIIIVIATIAAIVVTAIAVIVIAVKIDSQRGKIKLNN